MRLFPHKYNGFLFQQDMRVVSSFDDFDWDITGISTSNAQRNNNRPKFSEKLFGSAVKIISVTLNDVDRDKDNLVIAMDVRGSSQYPLYALDEFGKQWYVMAVCVGLKTETTEGKTASFGYIFEIDDPTWIEVVENSDTWVVTTSGDTHTVHVDGNQLTNPVIEITGGTPAGYYPYTQYVKNYNPISYVQADGIDITGGGWNTAALVAAGKMLSSGADVRVMFDGIEIPFWVGGGGWNSATTKLFISQTWQAGQSMALKTALNNSTTPPLIEWQVADAIKKTLAKLPVSGMVRVGTEEISYTNLSATLCRAAVVERNIRGTTIAAHSIGDLCYWVEHDIRIIYGNPAAVAPVYEDTNKPVFTLATSSNISRVLAVFGDEAMLRTGSFVRLVINDGKGKLNRVYSGFEGAIPDVDPATNMGMEIAAYLVQGKVKPETADLAWMFYHPAIITTVTTTGEKYKKAVTTTWPKYADLESSVDGKKWVKEWGELIPASANTWTAFTNTAAETITANSKYIRYHFSGSINAITDNTTDMEVHTVTIALNSSNVIQTALNGELANFRTSFELQNLTTGESLFVDYSIAPSATLVIDTEKMTSTYKGMNAIRCINWDAIRTDWFKLVPGDNSWKYIAPGAGGLSIVIKTHNRGL